MHGRFRRHGLLQDRRGNRFPAEPDPDLDRLDGIGQLGVETILERLDDAPIKLHLPEAAGHAGVGGVLARQGDKLDAEVFVGRVPIELETGKDPVAASCDRCDNLEIVGHAGDDRQNGLAFLPDTKKRQDAAAGDKFRVRPFGEKADKAAAPAMAVRHHQVAVVAGPGGQVIRHEVDRNRTGQNGFPAEPGGITRDLVGYTDRHGTAAAV